MDEAESTRSKRKISCARGKLMEEDMVVDLTDDGDDEENVIHQLLIENSVLETQKKKAEAEAEAWKKKFKDLELWLSQVDDITVAKGGKQLLYDVIRGDRRPDIRVGKEHLQITKKPIDCGPASDTPGTPYRDSPCCHTSLVGKDDVNAKSERGCQKVVRRHLSFEETRTSDKKIAPSTPIGCRPAHQNIIDVFDSENESDIHCVQLSATIDQENGKARNSTNHVITGTLDGKKNALSENQLGQAIDTKDYEDDLDDCKDSVPHAATSKRKRAAKIIASETESDEDDNIPISKLKKMHHHEPIPNVANDDANCSLLSTSSAVNGGVKCTKRRLATLRQREETVKLERGTSNKASDSEQAKPDYVEEDESNEEGSESEGESLGGFIVHSYDVSDDSSVRSDNKSEPNSDVDFDDILSKFHRSKDQAYKWDFEGDMLSAFGKDIELCMRAVCALYRQQTSDEQVSKETKYINSRGFSKFDALRGSDLASFLTDGDPHGDLKKSVKQLKERGSQAVELCRTLATRYSKQLFDIYKNKEDPLFLPC